MKLMSRAKKKQMDSKYSEIGLTDILDNANSEVDLQGFRNLLVDSASRLFPEKVLDLGGGVGGKSVRLARTAKKINIDILDFSEQASSTYDALKDFGIAYKCSSAELFLENTETLNYDLIMMFGFLHEVEDSGSLLKLLRDKQAGKGLVFFSDNTLYKDSSAVLHEFVDCGYRGIFLEKVFAFGHLKIFKGKSGVVDNKYMLMWHKGRVDQIHGIFSLGLEAFPELSGMISIGKLILLRKG